MRIITKRIVSGGREYEVMSVVNFIDTYHKGLQPQAIGYAMEKGTVDYCRIGHEKLVVLTDNTKNYVPNQSREYKGKPTRVIAA